MNRTEEIRGLELQVARQGLEVNDLKLRMERTQIREREVALDLVEELIQWYGFARRVYEAELDRPPLPLETLRNLELKPETKDFNSN